MIAQATTVFSPHPFVHFLGWFLVHSLWQAILIAAVTALLLISLRRRSANLRYIVGCIALMLMLAAPLLSTICFSPTPNATKPNRSATPVVRRITPQTYAFNEGPRPAIPPRSYEVTLVPQRRFVARDPLVEAFANTWSRFMQSTSAVAQSLVPWFPWMVGLWSAGCSLLAARLIAGLRTVSKLRASGQPLQDERCQTILARLQATMQIRSVVRLLESPLATVPAVIGWLRPIVLMPASMSSGLTISELESLLAHELAHIRRHDYLLNVIQSLAETILFFHPLVWWLSRVVRTERENCCDDMAVMVCGNRIAFARALARMEELRSQRSAFALAASGGSLLARIRRVVGQDTRGGSTWIRTSAAVLVALGGLVATVGVALASSGALQANTIPLHRVTSQNFGTSVSPQTSSTDPTVERPKDDESPPPIIVIGEDDGRVTECYAAAQPGGRSVPELIEHFALSLPQDPAEWQGRIVNQETIVSAQARWHIGTGMDADEVNFSLPEGSGMRALFVAEKIEIEQGQTKTLVKVTDGHVDLIDAVGVTRATASADGGAKTLLVELTTSAREGTIVMRTDQKDCPVQVRMITETGAPADEKDPPHGAIRYQIQPSEGDVPDPVRMKMQWHYDLKQLVEDSRTEDKLFSNLGNGVAVPFFSITERMTARGISRDEAVAQLRAESDSRRSLSVDGTANSQSKVKHSSQSENKSHAPPLWKMLLWVKQSNDRQRLNTDPSTELDSREPDNPDEWGPRPKQGDLRARLTLQTEKPIAGQPLRLKLEIKNFGILPQEFDPQDYYPFRSILVTRVDGQPDFFIGPTPQTIGHLKMCDPGETVTVWEGVDAAELYMLEEGNYTIEAGVRWKGNEFMPSSNVVHVNVLAGEMPPFKQLVLSLQKTLPKDWRLSSGHSAISLSHSPTNLKADVTSIQIWFTTDKLPDELERIDGNDQPIVHYLGKHDLGFANVMATKRAPELWPDYLNDVCNALGFDKKSLQDPNQSLKESTQTQQNPEAKQKQDAEVFNPYKLWSATGRVTDGEGKPIAGAVVRAHCGMGTLRETGSATTDNDGKYTLQFGPGIWSEDKVNLQAATISVQLDGHFEKNLHRQGDLLAANKLPETEIGWGGRKAEDVFLPGKPKTLDFVLLPAARLLGTVLDQDGKKMKGVRVSLTGPKMPPSSSVVAQTKTNENGKFEIDDIPTGFAYQILVEPVKAEPPWLAWSSPPIEFTADNYDQAHFRYRDGDKLIDFSAQSFTLQLKGEGVNWKTSLEESQSAPLAPKYDGLSTADGTIVKAGMAWLELGK